MLAVFPDEEARSAAQAQLDPATPGCGDDPRVVRPGTPTWVGVQNVLVKAYGADVVAHAVASLGGHEPDRYLPLPAASLDESYRVVDDAEAARAAGFLDGQSLAVDQASNTWFRTYQQATYRRFVAHALTYTIGNAAVVTQSNVDAATWAALKSAALLGTARLCVVDHPDSTDPALRTETIVAYEKTRPDIDTWGLIVLASPPPS